MLAGRCSRIWKDSTEIDLKEEVWECVDEMWRAVVNLVPQGVAISWLAEQLFAFR